MVAGTALIRHIFYWGPMKKAAIIGTFSEPASKVYFLYKGDGKHVRRNFSLTTIIQKIFENPSFNAYSKVWYKGSLFLLSLSFLGRSRPKRGSGVKWFREPLIRFYSYQKYIVCTSSSFSLCHIHVGSLWDWCEICLVDGAVGTAGWQLG